MARTDTDTGVGTDAIVGLARDVAEVKGIVTSQAELICDLNTRFNQFAAKFDRLIVYPIWGLAAAIAGMLLGFDELVRRIPDLFQ